MKQISLIACTKDKSKCNVFISDFPSGKNMVSFYCSIDSVSDIVKSNLNDVCYG